MSESYLLLAVKSAMGKGMSAVQGGNKFSSFYGISSLNVAVVPMYNMGGYIGVMIDEITSSVSNKFGQFANDFRDNLEMVRDLEAYHYPAEKINCNSVYDNGHGTMNVWVYRFCPINREQDCQCEEMSVSLNFRLADDIVILYHKKKSWFGSKSWTEKKRIPAAVRAIDFINALCICIAPLLQTNLGVQTPTGLATELKESAALHPNVIPSDDIRRTIYDPIKKMNVVVNDPAILALIPPKWEICHSEQVIPTANWEIDA